MKKLIPISAILLIFLGAGIAEMPESEADFISQFRDALSARDSTKMDALTYQHGMCEKDKALTARSNQMLVQYRGDIQQISIKPLPEDFQTMAVAHGRKFEMTGEPQGLIEAEFTSDGPMGASTSSTPFTIIDGVYFIVGPKSTDLGWKGPADKMIVYSLVGQGADEAQIVVTWNASGVDLSRKFSESSSTFWGQYIDSVTVTSDSDDSALKLLILEDGKTIYTSDPLNGKGLLEYKRQG